MAALALGLVAPAAGRAAVDAPSDAAPPVPPTAPREDVHDDATHLEALEFPGDRVRDAFRVHFQSRFVPDAGIDDAHTSLYRPELRTRITVPLSPRSVVRVTALGGMGRYDLRGSDPFFGDSLDVYETRLSVQGAYLLNDEGFHLWQADERWSLMSGLRIGSDFESGAFDEGMYGATGLGLGLELPGALQVALGVSVEANALGGLGFGPVGFLRWDVTEDVTLRNRGAGVQLEYDWSSDLEVFVTGFRSTDSYALEESFCPVGTCPPTTPPLDDLVLQDRMVLTGVGFEWKASPEVRINAELGAVAWRKLRVHSDDLGTIVSRRGDPALYFEIRFEVRP